MQFACNPLVYRQTAASRFSYFAGSWDELVAITERHFHTAVDVDGEEEGLRKKVTITGADCAGFFSGVAVVDENTVLEASCRKRLPDELPYIQHLAVNGKKEPALCVDIILYHRDRLTLEERTFPSPRIGFITTLPEVVEADWQIISVNCRATEEKEPLTPQAMARNDAARLGLPEGAGGTPATYTAEQYRRSIQYWSNRAMVKGS